MVSYSLIWKIEMSKLEVFKILSFFFWTVHKQKTRNITGYDSLTVDKLEDHQIMI